MNKRLILPLALSLALILSSCRPAGPEIMDAEELVSSSDADRIITEYIGCNLEDLASSWGEPDQIDGRYIWPVALDGETKYVETVVQLSKGSVSSQEVKVKFSMDDVDPVQYMDKSATYEQIKDYVKEHTRLIVSHLNIAQVKRKNGIIERECYNHPKSDDSRQPNCTVEKEKAIVEALKHFKII